MQSVFTTSAISQSMNFSGYQRLMFFIAKWPATRGLVLGYKSLRFLVNELLNGRKTIRQWLRIKERFRAGIAMSEKIALHAHNSLQKFQCVGGLMHLHHHPAAILQAHSADRAYA